MRSALALLALLTCAATMSCGTFGEADAPVEAGGGGAEGGQDAGDGGTPPTDADTAAESIVCVQQEAAGVAAPAATEGISFPSNVTAGNTIIVGITFDKMATLTSIDDTLGNVYAPMVGPGGDTSIPAYLYAASNIKGGACKVNVTISQAANLQLFIHEYAGLAATSALDVAVAANGAPAAPMTATVHTSADHELLFALGISSAQATPGAGFTMRTTHAGNFSADKIVTTAGNYTATGSSSNGFWVLLLASLKGR